MTITKIFINDLMRKGNIVEVESDNFFYLTRVLRHKCNDRIFLITKGHYHLAKITEIGKNSLLAEIEESREIGAIDFNINLFFGVLKGEKNDLVIKAGTQYAVYSFHPLLMERTVVKLNKEERIKKRERFQRVAQDMAREAFLGYIPEVNSIEELKKADFPEGLKILFYEGNITKRLSDLEEDIKKCTGISLLFGPEGGIEENEVDYLIGKGFIPVTLGERMLKAEFAIIAGINIVSFIKAGKVL